METRCLAWNVKDEIMGSFEGGGPKYFLPYRCHETKMAGQDICAKCYRKKEGPRKNKNSPARWWGLVSDPITDFGEQISHLAFSPWFMDKLKTKSLSPESTARAKKAIERARDGVPNSAPLPSIPQTQGQEVKVEEVKVEAPVVKKKPRVVKPKEEKENKEKQPRKPRAKKEEVVPPVNFTPQAILSEEKPLEVEDVIEVQVKPFEHAGNMYYMDGKKSKLYDRQKDGGCKGIYMGRWDSVLEKIIKDDDSDREWN